MKVRVVAGSDGGDVGRVRFVGGHFDRDAVADGHGVGGADAFDAKGSLDLTIETPAAVDTNCITTAGVFND